MVSFSEPSVNQTLDLGSTVDNLDWLGFLDKSNVLKIPDCRSFSVLKTMTRSPKTLFSALRASFWSKNKGVPGPPGAPPLDLPQVGVQAGEL